jgi:hypothetical protein
MHGASCNVSKPALTELPAIFYEREPGAASRPVPGSQYHQFIGGIDSHFSLLNSIAMYKIFFFVISFTLRVVFVIFSSFLWLWVKS